MSEQLNISGIVIIRYFADKKLANLESAHE